MALTALAGLMTGLLVSAIVPNNDQAMSLVPLPLIPQVIFAGVLFSLDNRPWLPWARLLVYMATRWMQTVSPFLVRSSHISTRMQVTKLQVITCSSAGL